MRGTLELLGVFVIIILALSLVETERKERTKGQTILATSMMELNKNDEKIVDRVSELELHIKELETLRANLNKLIEEREEERRQSNEVLNQVLDTKEVEK